MPLVNLLLIAWRNLWAHRMRAILTIGGVTVGVAAIIFLVALGFGLENLVTKQVATFEAFSLIDVPSANLKTGRINREAINRIQAVGHIKSIDEVVDLAGRVRLASQESTSETIAIAAMPNYFKIAELPIESGRVYDEKATNEAVINKALTGLLGYNEKPETIIGQTIYLDLIIAEDLRVKDEVEGPIVREKVELKVVGLTNTNPNPSLYIPLTVTEANGVINRSSLKVRVDDRKNVPTVRQAIENIGFSTEYVGDTVEQITQVFSLFRVVLGGFGMIALLVAALGAFNVLTISLIERIREIGLLKILGIHRRDIFKLFIAESILIGFLGGLFGIGLGNAIGAGLNGFLRTLAAQAGADPVKIYVAPTLFIVTVALGSLVIGFLTGFYPAYRAIKTSPLDVLRYE